MSQKRAAIYILVEKQCQPETEISKQKAACWQYAEAAKLKVVKIYSEVSNSIHLSQRPVLRKLLTDSKNGIFDVIIVQRADRIGDVLDVAIYKHRLTTNNVELEMVERTMKSSPEEQFHESILESILESTIGPLINRLEELNEYA